MIFYVEAKEINKEIIKKYRRMRALRNYINDLMDEINEINNEIETTGKIIPYWTVYQIPKKSGGLRNIYEPNQRMKEYYKLLYQYFILIDDVGKDLTNLFKGNSFQNMLCYTYNYVTPQGEEKKYRLNWDSVKTHFEDDEYCHGFTKGKSIITHASKHCDSKYFLKMDVEKAFPSIKFGSIYKVVKTQFFKGIVIEQILSKYVTNILQVSPKTTFLFNALTVKGVGSIEYLSVVFTKSIAPLGFLITGTSISPWILNRHLHSFDKSVGKYCRNNDMLYSRYADDICISANKPINKDVIHFVEKMLGYRHMRVNADKTVRQTYKQKNVITGIVITYDKKTGKGKIGIGHKVVDDLKNKLYNILKLNVAEVNQLMGMLSYLESVDKDKYNYLCQKYYNQIKKYYTTKVF